MKPPVAKRVPRITSRHDRRIRDDYGWLRDRDDPDVRAYLEAENAYTEAAMRHTEALQRTLYAEMLGRIKETDRSVPVRIGPFAYYTRTEHGKPYAMHYRTAIGSNDEQLLLDENELAADRPYFRLGAFEVSPDHRLLAYSFDGTGEEKYQLRFVDLASGALLDERIEDAYDSVEWAADNRTVFYNTIDPAHRPWRVHRHRLGDDPADDVTVFEEPDESFFVGLDKTKNKRFLLLCLESNTTCEVHVLEADRPEEAFRVLCPRRQRVEYSVEQHGERWLILTNERAVNFKLVAAPLDDPGRENWAEILPHRADVKLDELHPFAGHLAIFEREGGLTGIRVIDLETHEQHRVSFPDAVYTVDAHGNPEFSCERLRFSYASLVTPDSVFDYDMRTRDRERLKRREVVGGYDENAYFCERIVARAPDGTEVPISLVRRRDRPPPGRRPLVLYAYGSYGISVDPAFDSGRLSLLDRGFAYAIAHVRGGGEMGRPWYEAGKLRYKQNSFTDFIACAEHLIERGDTSAEGLAVRGGSAGGLLVGAVCNQRPDLFAAAVAKVPFVDVVNTMVDPSIPLTVIEWEEWGDPRQEDDHDRMLAYSPYDNVQAREYPALLIMTGLNDPRVAYWEPAKWTAKLRALKTDSNPLLLRTDMDAGHAGASGRYERIRELAFEYAFLIDRLG